MLLTLQGDWAGNAYAQSGCGADMNACIACEISVSTSIRIGAHLVFFVVVDNNPGAFAEAYWTVNSLRVYTPSNSGLGQPPSTSPPPPPPSSPNNPPPSSGGDPGLGGLLPGLGSVLGPNL